MYTLYDTPLTMRGIYILLFLNSCIMYPIDFTDLPDMTVQYIDLSVLRTSCLLFVLHLFALILLNIYTRV